MPATRLMTIRCFHRVLRAGRSVMGSALSSIPTGKRLTGFFETKGS